MTAQGNLGEPQDDGCQENQPVDGGIQETDIEAYNQLNNELDEINNCLDALETKNDNLHEEITKLLEESRQIRSELTEGNSTPT